MNEKIISAHLFRRAFETRTERGEGGTREGVRKKFGRDRELNCRCTLQISCFDYLSQDPFTRMVAKINGNKIFSIVCCGDTRN